MILRHQQQQHHFGGPSLFVRTRGVDTMSGEAASAVAPSWVDLEVQPLVSEQQRNDTKMSRRALMLGSGFCCGLLVLVFALYGLVAHSLWSLPDLPPLDTTPRLAPSRALILRGENVCGRAQWNATRPSKCGARAWMSQATLDHLGEDVLPAVVGRLSKLFGALATQVEGETTSAGFTWELSEFSFGKLSVGNSAFSFVPGKGIRYSVNRVEVGVSLRYRVCGTGLLALFSSSGGISINLGDGTSFSGLLGVGADNFGRPNVSLCDKRVKLDLAASVAARGGGIFNTLTQAFVQLIFDPFQWIFEEALDNVLEVALTQFVTEDVADMLAEVNPLIPMDFDCLAVDMSICSMTTFDDHAEIMVRGAVVDVSRPNLVYPAEPLPLPSKLPEKVEENMMAVSMSSWIVNSAVWVFTSDRLDIVNVSLNKEFRDLHNLLEWVWPGLDLGLELYVLDSPKMSLDEGRIGAHASLKMDIVDYGSGRKLLRTSIPAKATFGVDIKDYKLHLDIDRISIFELSATSGKCDTILGDQCVFPFTYRNKTYDACTDADTTVHRFWCATKVDARGNFIGGEWGTCTASCHVVSAYILPWLQSHLDGFLEKYVHSAVDLQRPLGDMLVLENTTLQILSESILVWSDFTLDLRSLLGARYGTRSADLLLQGEPLALA